MPRFFGDVAGDTATISGEDAVHIARSLRMKEGEHLTICDLKGTDYDCVIDTVTPTLINLKVLSATVSLQEPTIKITLFQGFPKSDKMDVIVQKAVELGAVRIVPVLCERSISRPDEKAAIKKQERFSKIALEAAKQSGRGIIPEVSPLVTFEKAAHEFDAFDHVFMFYEGGGTLISSIIDMNMKSIAVLIGPEGGFSEKEVDLAQRHHATTTTLGKRILRTETAGIAALAALLFATGNMN